MSQTKCVSSLTGSRPPRECHSCHRCDSPGGPIVQRFALDNGSTPYSAGRDRGWSRSRSTGRQGRVAKALGRSTVPSGAPCQEQASERQGMFRRRCAHLIANRVPRRPKNQVESLLCTQSAVTPRKPIGRRHVSCDKLLICTKAWSYAKLHATDSYRIRLVSR